MIFSMITGDMFTFSIIYIIFLFGFSQARLIIILYFRQIIFLFSGFLLHHEKSRGRSVRKVPHNMGCSLPHDSGRIWGRPWTILKMKKSFSTIFIVWWFWCESLPCDGQDGVCVVPNPDPHPPAEHVDSHDGQYLRYCYWEVRERVPQAGKLVKARVLVTNYEISTYFRIDFHLGR